MQEGHDVIVISPEDEYVGVLEAEGIRHIDIFMDNKGISPLRDFGTLLKLFFCYRQHRFDIVLHFTIKPVIYGGLISRFLNTPYINTITGLGTVFISESWVTSLVRFLYRCSQRDARRIFFQNHDDMNLFLQEGLVEKSRVSIVPGSGINMDYYKSDEAPVNEKHQEIVFLLIARMLRDKGVNEFVEAARLIRNKYTNVRFQLLGPVDVENKTAIARSVIDQWVEEGVIEYYPPVDDVRCYIEKASCVVLPSYREGLPRTLLEAAAMSKPLIATDTAGCRDIVLDGVNGYLCDVADAIDLARKLELMIGHTYDERLEMGKASRRHVIEKFDESSVIPCYLDVINR